MRRGGVEHRGLLGRAQVVVTQKVPHGPVLIDRRHVCDVVVTGAASQRAAACQRGDERVGLLGRQDQRRREPDHVRLRPRWPGSRASRNAGPQRIDAAAATGAVSTMPSSSPAPRTPATSGLPSAVDAASRSRSPTRFTWSSRPSRGDRAQHGQRGGAADRVAAERRAVRARARAASAAAPNARHAPIGSPPPRPLASVTMSGSTPVGLVGKPVAGTADAGLHLVERQQGTVLRGDRPRRGEVARRRHDRRRSRPGSVPGSPSRSRR